MNSITIQDNIVLAGMRWEGPITVQLEHYFNNQPALRLLSPDENGIPMPLCTATTNVGKLDDGFVSVKDHSENQGVLAWLMKHGIVQKPQDWIVIGFVNVAVCELVTSLFNPEAQPPQPQESTMDNSQPAVQPFQDVLSDLFSPFEGEHSTDVGDYIDEDDLIELLETGSVTVEIDLPDESVATLILTCQAQRKPED